MAGKQEAILKTYWEQVKTFNKINCMAKPYSKEQQQQMTFDGVTRVKRESFCLRLAIMNHDDKIFKFLWNENRLLWNLGHFIVCIQQIIASNWESGLKLLLASTTTKVILMSVNTVADFVEVVELLKQVITELQMSNQRMAKKLREYMFTRPYFIYCIFIEITPVNSNVSNITQLSK